MAKADTDCTMTWDAYWAYFMSPSCNDVMRKDMLKLLQLKETLENMSPDGQVDVMRNAPEPLRKSTTILNVLKPQAIQELVLQQRETVTVTAMPTYEEIRDEVYGKYKSK